jgi:transposase-like protein
MEGFVMKVRDQLKLEIVYKVLSGQMQRLDGQIILGISERTLRRYLRSYNKSGVSFVRHGNFRRAPLNRKPVVLKLQVQKLVQETYFDFNMVHLSEKLFEELGIQIKYSTLRRWCHEIQHVKHAGRRRAKARHYRQRMSQEGIMLQMDGSHHHWFGGRLLCLMAAIDDATGEVFAKFYEGETTLACMDLLKQIITTKGVFKVLYTDKAGVYGGIKRENFSQVERALGDLGAQVIYAHSPEAKGRIERLFKTLQDRLVPELRHQGIDAIESANEYLQTIYLPHNHNPKSMVLAENSVSAYRALPAAVDLEAIFCIKEYRIVGRDHTVSVGGDKWLIVEAIKHSISKQKIEIRYDKWGSWVAYFAKRKIKLVKIQNPKKMAA